MTEVQKILKSFNAGDYNNVIKRSLRLIKKNPNLTNLYNIIGLSYQKKRMNSEAKKSYLKGLNADPDSLDLTLNLGNILKYENTYEEAEQCYKKILKKNPEHLMAILNYGNLKNVLNQFDDSLSLYNRALEIDHNNFTTHFNKAFLLQTIGKSEEAIIHAKRCLELNPDFTPADNLLSRMINYKTDTWHLISMEKKNENKNLSPSNKWNLLFSLALAYEKLGDLKKSIMLLIEANAFKRKSINFTIKQEIDQIKIIKNIFKNINFNDFKTNNINTPNIVFILGMPRSGSTLIEQIISCHPEVYGAGELPELPRLIKQDVLNVANSSNLLSMNFNEQTSQYMKFVSYFKSNKKYITDKNPSNFLWIGFIKIMFPNAKIIHTYREPKDNCLSIFKNLFPGNDMAWCYDQKELGQYYNLYEDLMQFWNKLLPNSIYNIKYENLIEDQESEIKKLISACGLEWNANCLNSHKNNKPIRTLSISQARQKIYKTSLNLSDNFKSELNELFTVLSK